MSDSELVRDLTARRAARVDSYLTRTGPGALRRSRSRAATRISRIIPMLATLFAILVAAGVFGALVQPLEAMGFGLTLLLMMLVAIAFMIVPAAPTPTIENLATMGLPLLPAQTERWLEAQRPALPAPAQQLADQISLRLDAIAPQLAMLDPREPAAYEIRKLMAEELPELVSGYRRVPEELRRKERNGLSPDNQLVDGLRVVDEELQRMNQQLASGDLDKLATQGRYLELKYRGENGEAR